MLKKETHTELSICSEITQVFQLKPDNTYSLFNQKQYVFRKKNFYQGIYETKDRTGNKIQFRLFNDKDLKFEDLDGSDLELEFDEDNQTDDQTLEKFIKEGIKEMMDYLDGKENNQEEDSDSNKEKVTKQKHIKQKNEKKKQYESDSQDSSESSDDSS